MSSILISYIKNNEEKQVNLSNYEKEKKYLFLQNYEINLNKISSLLNKKTIKEIGFKEDIEYLRPIMTILKDCTIKFIEKLNEYKKENNSYYFCVFFLIYALQYKIKLLFRYHNERQLLVQLR